MSRRRKARKPTTAPPPEAPSATTSGSRAPWAWLGLAALLCGAVLVGYLPALHGGFIWDDRVLLAENEMIRAPDGLYRFWLTTEAHDYWPLTSTTFWLEWRLWGTDPTGYHVTNLALHAIEALLLWAVLLRLGVGGAYLAALVFAVHPVNVESVAWIAQRKNLVAMLFLLLATLFFLKADVDEDRRGPPSRSALGDRWYWLSLAMFLLALLGKGSVAPLPAILLLLAWWKRGRVVTRDVVRVAPFAAVAAALVIVNIWFQTHGGPEPIRTASLGERLLGAGAVPWFYLFKALLPVHLAFVYPQWHAKVGDPLWWLPLLAAVGVSAALLRFRGTWGRPFLMAWAFFCAALLPVMGLTDVYFMKYSLVADHYQHLAIVGVIALAAAGWSEWQRRRSEPTRRAAFAVAAAVVATFLGLTVRQSGAYRDEETLYRATITANPGCWLAHYNLAVDLKAQGRRQEEILHLEETVRLRPEHAGAHNNLALALLEEGRYGEALPHAEAAARLQPGVAAPLVNLGIALSRAGRPAEALGPLERAVELDPVLADSHYNLGLTLAGLGRLPEAISAFEEALRLKPDDPEARIRLARALLRSDRPREAAAQYEEAVRLSPGGPAAPEAHYNLGVLLTAEGRKEEGLAHYARALTLKPDYAEAHYNLAVALLADGRGAEAVSHLEEAVRSKPELIVARMSLAESYARSGRLPEAIAQAQAALASAPPGARADLERRIEALRARARARPLSSPPRSP
jgi:tetratricopeptide (TPR) repeat protein